MDPIKAAFAKVKQDIFLLQSQISDLTHEIKQIKRTLEQTQDQTNLSDRQTENTDTYTDTTDRQTAPHEIGGFSSKNTDTSTRNQGVQTDRQTNRQTDREAQSPKASQEKFALTQSAHTEKEDRISRIDKVSQVLNSLDSIKKDLRQQFKKLTQQEMLVFSTVYQLEDQGLQPDYTLIANKTNLSESSIRDYVLKLIKKGIPIDKIKENNKRVTLSIPQNLRRMTSLDTILQLRDL